MPLGRIVAGLDVGTTKVTTIIAEIDDNDAISVIGVGQTESRGVERGMIVHLEETVESIQKSAERAQHMAGCRISSVFVGIGGDHIRGINSHAAVTVGKITNEISDEDVKRVIDHAQNVSMPADVTVIHVIPQEFRVDDQKHIIQPVGLAGSRLEGEVHIVRGAATAEQNLRRAVQKAGFQVDGIVMQPLASALAVLSPDEQEWGVAMVDIGGGTTDIAVYHRRCIRHTAVLSLGSAYVTSDIAIGCSILMDEAEQLKKQYGRAFRLLAEQEHNAPEDAREQPDIGYLRENTRAVLDAKIPEPKFSAELARVIEMRMVELLGAAWYEIRRSGHHEYLASGVVVTGGGAMIKGTAELAQRVFGVPVRIGSPLGVGGIREGVTTPVNASGVGLVLYGASQVVHTAPSGPANGDRYPLETLTEELERKRLVGMRRWLKEFFA